MTDISRDNDVTHLTEYLEAWKGSILKRGGDTLRDTLVKQMLVYQAIRKVCERRSKTADSVVVKEGGLDSCEEETGDEGGAVEDRPGCEAWVFDGGNVHLITYYGIHHLTVQRNIAGNTASESVSGGKLLE